MEKIINRFSYYYKKYNSIIFFITKILCIIILILSLLYFFERYILYKIIYYAISKMPFIDTIYLFSYNFVTILLIIYLHIWLIRLVVYSIIFMQGGLFKKILVHEEFFSFIYNIRINTENAIEKIKSGNINEAEYYINQLSIFKKSCDNMISKKISLKITKSDFDSELNESLMFFYNYKKTKNSKNIEFLLDSLNQFEKKISEVIKLPWYKILYKFKYNESLFLMEDYMMNSFSTHNIQKVNLKKNFDIFKLSPKDKKGNNDILAIYCNQNAMCCELYSIGKDNIEFYLNDLNCNIIIWNYKGFGLRKGFTTFSNIDKDVNILSDYIKKNYNNHKIIIHGCSIGGYSSIKLAQKLSDLENVVLIADRTFANIKNVVETFNFKKILIPIYSFLFPKFIYDFSNVENYISLPSNKKLILFDAYDEVLQYIPVSLVYNLTKKYYNDIIKPKLSKYNKYFSFFKNSDELSKQLKQLAISCNDINFDENGRIFLQHLYKYINSIEEFFMFFVIFGFPFNRYKVINSNSVLFNNYCIKIPFILKKFIDKEKDLINKEVLDIISAFNFLFIKSKLECDLDDNDIYEFNYDIENDKLFSIVKNHENELKKYLGSVHRIHCGHNGKLKNNDIKAIKEFLISNKYLN